MHYLYLRISLKDHLTNDIQIKFYSNKRILIKSNQHVQTDMYTYKNYSDWTNI